MLASDQPKNAVRVRAVLAGQTETHLVKSNVAVEWVVILRDSRLATAKGTSVTLIELTVGLHFSSLYRHND
jgi:hypothetical protein